MAGRKKQPELTAEEKLQQALVPEAEQPYKVPDNWCWTRLGDVTEVIGGGTPSTKIKEYYDNGTIPWLSPADLSDYSDIYIERGAKNITELGLAKSSARLLPKDTVCLSSRAPIGYVAIAANSLCTNQGFKSFLPSSAFISKYLYWYLKSNVELLKSYASGTTFLELSASKASLVKFPLPPLAEQQRIVERIETLFAKLDEAKEKLQNTIETFETRKAAILHKAFTGELTANWRKQHGLTMDSWEEKQIENIGSVKGGKRVPKGMHLTYENTGHPYIKAGNLKQGTVINKDIMYVPNDVLQFIKNYTVSAGDVYITNVGACIGDCGIIPLEFDGANLTENAVKITNLLCDGQFLAYYLNTNTVQSFIKSLIASATLGKLSIANIKSIKIKCPMLDEQTEIVRIIDNLLAKEQQAYSIAQNAITQIDLIKKSILARAFRGQLATNNPADEPAIELLKRVL